MIHTNLAMQALLAELDLRYEDAHLIALHENLNALLAEGIEIFRGCYLLKSCVSSNIDKVKSYDLTDLECGVNHIHIEWHLEKNAEANTVLRQAIAYSRRLQATLSSSYPETTFRIIFGTDLSNLRYCVVRFHKIRDDEPDWIDVSNLEGFKWNAIMVIDVPD